MPLAYYNENDPYAVAWLRNLIASGLLPDGIVDERSILDVTPQDLKGFTQHHFFAGIGGWPLALRIAGWPDERPAWTGSPPCQPFSVAGLQRGKDDERHLAPQWLELTSQHHPPVLFGEQVENAIRHGWLDDLQAHLEAQGYACGKVVLPACGVGAPHIRQRIWFVAERLAHPESERCREARDTVTGPEARDTRRGAACGLDDTIQQGLERHPWHGDDRDEPGRQLPQPAGSASEAGCGGRLADAEHTERRPVGLNRGDGRDRQDGGREETHGEPGACGEVRGLADTDRQRQHEQHTSVRQGKECDSETARYGSDGEDYCIDCGRNWDWCICPAPRLASCFGSSPPDSFWRAADWLYCRDGKWRPVEPGTFPLVTRLPADMGSVRPGEDSPFRTIWKDGKPVGQEPWRVGMLRGYGNSIVPQVAAEVIRAYMEDAPVRMY